MPDAPYQSPHDYGRTHPDITEVLATAVTLLGASESDPARDRDTAQAILTAVAARRDLTVEHLPVLLDHLADADWDVAYTLLINPAVRDHPDVSDLFTPDHTAILLTAPQPLLANHATQIVATIGEDSRLVDYEGRDQFYAAVRERLGPDLLAATFERLIAEADPRHLRYLASNPLLPAATFDAMLNRALDPTADFEVGFWILSALAARSDLAEAQALGLLDAARRFKPRTADTGFMPAEASLLLTLGANTACPDAAMVKILTHRLRDVRDTVLRRAANHTAAALIEAARRRQPKAVLALKKRNRAGCLPDDAAAAVLDDLNRSRVRGERLTGQTKRKIVHAIALLTGSPAIWDRAYALIQTLPETGADDAPDFYAAALGRGAYSRRHGRLHEWMARHEDPRLRALVVPHYFTPAQVTAALDDPATEVRIAAIQHPLATAEILTAAQTDTHALVRGAVLRHGRAIAEHVTRAAEDSSMAVRVTRRVTRRPPPKCCPGWSPTPTPRWPPPLLTGSLAPSPGPRAW